VSAAHADERRALLAASDAINAELAAQHRTPRNERTAHAVLAATIDARRELARSAAPAAHAARPVPRWMQRVLGVLASADDPARIAPAPTGSREIPAWLLAMLIVLTVAALALFAPAAQAGPINCQGDVDYFARVTAETPAGLSTWWTDCGYRYELPAEVLAITPPTPPTAPISPVPEPAAWQMLLAGATALIVGARLRRARGRA
jgi:hypothetical protein